MVAERVAGASLLLPGGPMPTPPPVVGAAAGWGPQWLNESLVEHRRAVQSRGHVTDSLVLDTMAGRTGIPRILRSEGQVPDAIGLNRPPAHETRARPSR